LFHIVKPLVTNDGAAVVVLVLVEVEVVVLVLVEVEVVVEVLVVDVDVDVVLVVVVGGTVHVPKSLLNVAGAPELNIPNFGYPTPCVRALNAPQGIVPAASLYTLTPIANVGALAYAVTNVPALALKHASVPEPVPSPTWNVYNAIVVVLVDVDVDVEVEVLVDVLVEVDVDVVLVLVEVVVVGAAVVVVVVVGAIVVVVLVGAAVVVP
jgi:hypothetical protein